MVYNVHENVDKVTGVIKPDGRGKHCNYHRVSSEDKENVLAHIKSFTLVDSTVDQKPIKNTYRVDLTSRKCMIFIKEIA